MKTWIAKVRVPNREMFWVGHFDAASRPDAKREARRFVSSILPLDTQIICIAQGRVDVQILGPEIPFNE